MSLLFALLVVPVSWAQDEGEALKRREAKAAYAEMQAAMYHLPAQGTLTWTLRTTLPGPDGEEMPPCLSAVYDLASRSLETRAICQDPSAAMLAQQRDALLLDEVLKLLLVWHDAPDTLGRDGQAWTRDGELVFAWLHDTSGEFMHVDPSAHLPVYSQDSRGLTVEFGFQRTPDGALMTFAQNRFRDGSAEIGMEMEHRLTAPGVWFLSHATLTQGDAYLGELWFDDLTYVP